MTRMIDARALGVTRIIVGAAAVIRAAVGWQLLTRFDAGIVKMPVVTWLPNPDSTTAKMTVVVWVVAAIAFSAGWRVSWSGTMLAAAVTTFLFLDHQTYANHLYLMALLVILLVVADAGAAHSPGAARSAALWPVMLIKIQISFVYFFTAVTKLNGDFLTGRVLAGTIRDGVIELPESLRTPAFLGVIAALAVITELFLAFFLWSERFRPAAFVLGLGLHVSITLLLGATTTLFVFSLLMLGVYPLFVNRNPITVVWDDDCGTCRVWIHRFSRLDALGLLEAIPKSDASHGIDPADVSHTMHVLSPQTFTGFAAVGQILERIVPTLWVAPLLRLPGVSHVGERWYRQQADRRTCEIQ